jgi:WD40 repeat protein
VHIIFTRDSRGLVVSYDTGLVETLSTATWAVVRSTQLNASIFGVDSLAFVGFNRDGSQLIAVGGYGNAGGNASLLWLDAATLEITKTVEHAHTGSVKSMALSPDGTLMATGASDGIVRVWDTKTRDVRQQLDFGGSEVQGVAFVDNLHLAVTPRRGDLLIMTLDPTELANVVRASLTRTFTATECTTYAIDPCPTLAEIRAP